MRSRASAAPALLLAVACAGEGMPRPPVHLTGEDGATGAGYYGIEVIMREATDPELAALSLVLWPELEPVESVVVPVDFPPASRVLALSPAAALEARWYAVLVDPSDSLAVYGAREIGDGLYAYRVYGASAPRVRSVTFDGSSGIVVGFSEPVTLPAAALPISVTSGSTSCGWTGALAGSSAMLTRFECESVPVAAQVEVLQPLGSPAGGTLMPVVIEVPDLRSGYTAPI